MPSKPVGITYGNSQFVVVCEDGSVWVASDPLQGWSSGKAIPESDVPDNPAPKRPRERERPPGQPYAELVEEPYVGPHRNPGKKNRP